MPDITTLIKKSDYDTKIAEIENKYVSNSGFDSRLPQSNVVTKRSFDAKIVDIENSINKFKSFDSSYFSGKNHFENDGTKNYLVFQPLYKYFTFITGTQYISSWKSKGLSPETIKHFATSDNSLTPIINFVFDKIRPKRNGNCLKQSKLQIFHETIVNIYIVSELGASGSNNSDPTLKNCLFVAVTLSKNADIDKYGYSGYENGFDKR